MMVILLVYHTGMLHTLGKSSEEIHKSSKKQKWLTYDKNKRLDLLVGPVMFGNVSNTFPLSICT